jgi:hypothetical protein
MDRLARGDCHRRVKRSRHAFVAWQKCAGSHRRSAANSGKRSGAARKGDLELPSAAAGQYGEQDSKGSLEPGKLADLAIREPSPLEVEPMAIK